MLKKEVINKRIEIKTSMERLTSTFKLYDEMLDKDEKYLLYNRFLAIIKEKIEQMDMSSYTKVDNFVKQLGYFDKFLKGSADLFDEFEEMKKNVVNRELKKEIMSLAKFIQTTESKPCVLMEIVRIIDRAPTNFKKIIGGASASFEKDKVLMYFLHKIVDREEPTLSNQQMEEVGRLEKQFGCLKGNDTN
jgi:hypothetical protein